MTTMTSVRLGSAAQALIDSRLDTIDRMLLGRVPRPDRLDIAREVEAQIFDLLADRGGDEPDRDDVLAVLARLDPPEAYLPDDLDDAAPAARPRIRAVASASRAPSGDDPRIARASGILGLVAMALIFLTPAVFLLGELTGSEIILIGGMLVTLAFVVFGGVLAIALGIFAKFRQVWSMIGVLAGSLALVLGCCGAIGLLLLL